MTRVIRLRVGWLYIRPKPTCILRDIAWGSDKVSKSVDTKAAIDFNIFFLSLRAPGPLARRLAKSREVEVYIRIASRWDNFEAENGLCKIECGLLNVRRSEFHCLDQALVAHVSAETWLVRSSFPLTPLLTVSGNILPGDVP